MRKITTTREKFNSVSVSSNVRNIWCNDCQCSKPKNVIFILSDNHRYDYMSFHPKARGDGMAEEGAHLANAFVITSMCVLPVGLRS